MTQFFSVPFFYQLKNILFQLENGCKKETLVLLFVGLEIQYSFSARATAAKSKSFPNAFEKEAFFP